MDPVEPSHGWGVLHLFYRVDRARAENDPRGGKRVLDAVESLVAYGHQALLFAVLGHKADLGVMALGPDLARLQTKLEVIQGSLVNLSLKIDRLLAEREGNGRRPARKRPDESD